MKMLFYNPLCDEKIKINPNERHSSIDYIPMVYDPFSELWSIKDTQFEDIIRLYNYYLTFIRNSEGKISQKDILLLGEQLLQTFSICSRKICQFNNSDKKCLNIGKVWNITTDMEILQRECCIHKWDSYRERWCKNCNDRFSNSNRRKGKGDNGIAPDNPPSPKLIIKL